MRKTYWDTDGNVVLGEEYPEEILEDQSNDLNASVSEHSIAEQMAKAFEIIMKNQKSNERPNLRKLSEKFVLEKFSGKGK